MIKSHSGSNMKLISKSACSIALAIPLICFLGESEATEINTYENQSLFENKKNKKFQFIHQSKINQFNSNFNKTLIAEETNQKQ